MGVNWGFFNNTSDNRKEKYEYQISNVEYHSESWFTFDKLVELFEERLPHIDDMGPEHFVSVGQKVKYPMGKINCDH